MKPKKHLENWIPLYLYDELNAEEKHEFELHIQFCESCKKMLKETRALHDLLGQRHTKEPPDFVVEQSRQRLLERLRREPKTSFSPVWLSQFGDFVRSFGPGMQVAAAAALLLIGILLGRFTASPSAGVGSATFTPTDIPNDPLISNVDMIQFNPASGQVTVRYKSVRDVSLSGDIDNPDIRKVLTHAIRSDDHPGRRLTAVKASSTGEFADKELEDALIHAMENDNVEGVRLKAARVLKNLPANQKIKQAFIRVLINERNSAIRIEALNALESLMDQRDVVPIFRDASRDDENEFVRLKAGRALERLDSNKKDSEL